MSTDPLRPGAPIEIVTGPRGLQGTPGDPTVLLAAITPGQALSVDSGGAPAAITPVPTSQRGAANGVATLDSASKIPTAQIPTIDGGTP